MQYEIDCSFITVVMTKKLLFGFDLQLDPGLSNLEPSGSELYLLLKFFKREEGWSRKWSSSYCF